MISIIGDVLYRRKVIMPEKYFQDEKIERVVDVGVVEFNVP